MKRIPGTKRRSFAHALTAAILLSCTAIVPALVPMASVAGEAVAKTAGGVSYMSGGVGADSIDRLSLQAGDFNLKLVFALKSGEYLSGVKVAIADAAGKTLLDTTSDGPWFMARLPAGSYQVVATFEGNAVKRQVAVGTTKRSTMDFRWASQ